MKPLALFSVFQPRTGENQQQKLTRLMTEALAIAQEIDDLSRQELPHAGLSEDYENKCNQMRDIISGGVSIGVETIDQHIKTHTGKIDPSFLKTALDYVV